MKQPAALALSLSAQIADDIRRSILGGELPAGQPLHEAPLAARYGVSRGPVRDALLSLAREGLLDSRPNVGARVSAPPPPWQREIIVRLRRDLETGALARWAGSSGRAGFLAALQANLADYLPACLARDLPRVVELDLRFHQQIVAAADPALLTVWRPVIHRMFLRYARHADLAESHAEHAAVLAALRARETDRAIELLGQHIQ